MPPVIIDKPLAASFNWQAREQALLRLLCGIITPAQAEMALEQWESVLAERPELLGPLPPDLSDP